MKKLLITILLLILLIPLKVNAGTTNISTKFVSFYYYDIQMNQIKNREFELQNMSGEKIVDLTRNSRGLYTVPLYIYNKEYNPNDKKELLFFDEEHRSIIEELISNNNYSNPAIYNEYISNIETDDIIFKISEGKTGYDGWGIFGKIPLKIVEKTENNPKTLYINATFDIRRHMTKMDLSIELRGEKHIIDSDADIREIHDERFKEEIGSNSFEFYTTSSEEFDNKYPKLKSIENYMICSSPIEGVEIHEDEPLPCQDVLIDNSAFETIDISDSINLRQYFKNLAQDTNIEILDVEDKTILKISDGKIIPLKKGETTIKMKIKNDIYNFKVKITGDIPNPNTFYPSLIFIIIFMSFISVIFIISINKIKYPQE